MTKASVEEMKAAIWAIAALLANYEKLVVLTIIFAGFSVLSLVIAFLASIVEILKNDK
jgi:hypothetical protein